jgi:hypothetical protein
MNYGNCLSLRGGLIIRKRAIGAAILATVLGTVRTKSVCRSFEC